MGEASGESIIIGSRASRLALWQANWVRDRLAAIGHEARIVEIHTSGDRARDRPLSDLEGRGVFVREIEESLARGKIDLAVHRCDRYAYYGPPGVKVHIGGLELDLITAGVTYIVIPVPGELDPIVIQRFLQSQGQLAVLAEG